MLSVETTKNITDYKSDFAGGFDIKETFSIGIGVVVGVVIILVCDLLLHVPMILCPYIAMPFVLIPIVNKFYKKNGMNFFEAKKREKKYKEAGGLSYISTESAENYLKYYEDKKVLLATDKEDSFEKQLKKLKRLALIGLGAFVLLVVVAIVLKIFVLKG